MASRSHRRRVALFSLAILLPCLVLVILSMRMIRQERELAEKRLQEEQRRRANEIRQELIASLEKIKLQEVTALATQGGRANEGRYQYPSVVLIGRVESNRLVLPWEETRTAAEFRQLRNEPAFARHIQQGELEEFATRETEKSAASYQQALNAARHPSQAAYARLLLGRALVKLGRWEEARAHYRRVLELPSELVDEHSVPFAFYAAERLLQEAGEKKATLERLRAESAAGRWMSPPATYLLQELAKTLSQTPDPRLRASAEEILGTTGAQLQRLEQALTLQNDFPTLGLQTVGQHSGNLEPLWVPYGQDTWFVSLAPELVGLKPVAVVVRAEAIYPSLSTLRNLSESGFGGIGLVTRPEAKGEPLGPNLPGVKVVFVTRPDTALARKWNLQTSFYVVILFLVLSVTLFGAYLLWRDMRRELRLAELRSQFVSSVSHELKTPLTAIRMFAETLRMGRSPDPKTHAEYLETIVNESERLTRLLNNVLDFSKIERGQKTYHPEPTFLPEVIEAAARAMKYPLAQQGFELRVEIENRLPPVSVDRDALEQAILNLLANAVKYSGGSRDIELRLRSANGDAIIQVTDHGVGIPSEEQTRIFEKFYRVSTPENRLIPGTGLGLTLVEHVAKAHGGHVEVQSAPGGGSTFSLHIPLRGGV